MKRIMVLLLVLVLAASLVACTGETGAADPMVIFQPGNNSGDDSVAAAADEPSAPATAVAIAVTYDAEDLEIASDPGDAVMITLSGDTVTVSGDGVGVEGSAVTITSAGAYHLSGTLDDGQIIVDTEDVGVVTLILNGVDVACTTGAPLYVANAEKAVVTLAAGSVNTLIDGASYVFADPETEEPNAALFSNDDLTINGEGALTVQANYNNGIASDDALKITGGVLTVVAVHDGIQGKDYVAIKAGSITVMAGNDGVQATSTEDAEQEPALSESQEPALSESKGYVAIEGGTLDITAGGDGIQAKTIVLISGGQLTLATGGGSASVPVRTGAGMRGRPGAVDTSTGSASMKGIKAGAGVTITGGTLMIDAADDALHSNGALTIGGGTLVLASGDDGIHADAALTIDNGVLDIVQSYEGLESAVITINGGTLSVVASDDALNASSANGESAWGGGPGGAAESGGNNFLYINGGYLTVDAGGDGLDANGAISMTGGTVIINGPTNNGNGALDYLGTFQITGGFLAAAGSAGMAMAPSASSTQAAVLVNLTQVQRAHTLFHIAAAEGGGDILTFAPSKEYQSVLVCSPELDLGAAYVVYTGGTATGAIADGLYTGGAYTAGTQVAGITLADVITYVGGMGGMRPGGGRRP